MKEKSNLQALLTALLLIVAGTLSPSNGVDERSYKTPIELLTTMFIVISAGLALYFTWNWIEKSKQPLNINNESK